MNLQINIETMHVLEVKTLRAFQGRDWLTPEAIEQLTDLDAARVRRALEWLKTRNAIDVVQEDTRRYALLTETGLSYAEKKIPELRILDLASQSLTMRDLQSDNSFDPAEISPAIGALKHSGLVLFADGGAIKLCDGGDCENLYRIQNLIERYAKHGEVPLDEMPEDEQREIDQLSRKRGKAKGIFKISERTFRTYALTETGKILLDQIIKKGVTGDEASQVLPEHLKDGAWREIRYRKYALDLKAPRVIVGKRNPYRQFLDFVKRKMLSMGFEEMRGDQVETEFWNMDALFMPQFHSARDIHDVYFVRQPTHATSIEEPYFSNVAAMHTNGAGTISKGWNYRFDKDKSRQLVLRSQGTALSARWLHKARVPGKYFAMARCSRPDSVDATHAADFFQVEGIVLGETITFRTLLGLLKMFAIEVAKAQDIKFLPAYFPFTEPSVEAHIKHPAIGWMEMGGAGIFRPEVTRPQGVDVPVIAWGLGLDRMAMVAMGIDDIRELFTTDLNRIRSTRVNFQG